MEEYKPLMLETFVVRIWREAASSTWRGMVVHLPDGESTPFSSLEQMNGFVAQHLSRLGGGATADKQVGEGERYSK
jgi:hypothetical protein